MKEVKNMRRKLLITAAFAFLLTGCANSAAAKTDETPAEDKSMIAGKWQLDKVYGVKEDGNMDELDPETNQSLYSVADGYFEFNEDGTGVHVMIDGPDQAEVPFTWTNDGGTVVVSEGEEGSKTESEFSFEANTLIQYIDAPEDSGYKQYESVYAIAE